MTLFLFYSSSGIPICEKIDPKTVNNQYFFISVLNMVNNFILKLKDQRKKDEEFFLIKTDNIIGEYYMKKMVEKKMEEKEGN